LEESYALVEGRGGDGRVLEDWDEDILVLISVRRIEEQLTRHLAAKSV